MDQADKQEYELGLILASESSLAEVISILSRSGAEIKRQDHPRKINLAYEIKKRREAYFAAVVFTLETSATASLDESFKFSPEVLRFLRVKLIPVQAQDQKPAVSDTPASPSPAPKSSPLPSESSPVEPPESLTNELLEKKLEEILK